MAVDSDDPQVTTLRGYRDLILAHDRRLRRQKKDLNKWDQYRRGDVPLKYMAPEIREHFGDRITQLIVNVAQMGVEAYEHRLDIDGVRLTPTSDSDDEQGALWRRLDMPLITSQVHDEMLGLGTGFTCVGVDPDDDTAPVVTAESPLQMTADVSPLQRTRSAMKRWTEDDGSAMRTLYLPDETVHLARTNRGQWDVVDRIEHDWHRVPVYRFLNAGHLLDEYGVPVFQPVIPVYEALNKMASDMMVGGEFHILPRRWATNVDEGAFVDEKGNPVSPLVQLIGGVWAIPGDSNSAEVRVGQFDASDLKNFHETIRLLFWMAGHLMGLPQSYTESATQNPAAEGAIKAGEIRLIKGSERKQKVTGPSWRGTWQSVMQIRNGGVMPDEADEVSMDWRNPATPTFAQLADGTVKLVATKDGRGRSVVPIDMARQRLGFTADERDAMAAMDAADELRAASALTEVFATSSVTGDGGG